MALNVQHMLNESCKALGADDPIRKHEFIETWLPEIVNEVERLRNTVVLLETRITELENEVEHLGGT